jgi:putative transposase
MEMGRKRRSFADKFEAQVAIEAVKGIKTLAELATEYQVHPNQISGWKRQLLVNALELFSSGKASPAKTEEEFGAKFGAKLLTQRITWKMYRREGKLFFFASPCR